MHETLMFCRLRDESARQESLSDDFSRCGDDHESVRVIGVDEAAQSQSLCARQNGDNHRLALVMERAVDILKRCAAMQIDSDEIDNRFRVGRDDLEAFFHAKAVRHVIDEHGFHQQAEDAEQAGLNAEAEQTRDRDERIGDHQRHADIHARIFADNHRDDVGSAAGCVQVEQNRRTERRKQDGKAQLKQRLIGQRMRHRVKMLHHIDGKRQQHGTVHRAEREVSSQKDIADDEQRGVDDQNKRAGRQDFGRQHATQNQRQTADAAGRKVVRKLEEVDADRHNQAADCQQKIAFKCADGLCCCGFHGTIDSFLSLTA